MDRKKIYQSAIFLIIGIVLFLFVYKGVDIKDLQQQLTQFSLFWIGVSVLINTLSQLVRAYRWKILFTPLDYKPKLYNLFFANLILGFTNQIIPRGGEIARLAVVNKTERIPVSKLVGITLVERLTDLMILIIIFFVLLVWQFTLIKELLSLPKFTLQHINAQLFILIAISIIAFVFLVIVAIKKLDLLHKFKGRIQKDKNDFREGVLSIYRIKNKTIYFFNSFLLYFLWLLMCYVLFLAYPPTEHLTFEVAAFTFGLATLAFLLPVQSGMGVWHFVVIQCLLLFNVGFVEGMTFSLVAHATTNLIYLVLGAISFALIPLVNRTQRGDLLQQQ